MSLRFQSITAFTHRFRQIRQQGGITFPSLDADFSRLLQASDTVAESSRQRANPGTGVENTDRFGRQLREHAGHEGGNLAGRPEMALFLAINRA